MNMNPSLFRAVEELTVYATERQAGFEAHQGSQVRQPGERNKWIRGILAGMAEVFGADPGELTAGFDRRLEAAQNSFGVVPLNSFEQKHMVQILCRYVEKLEELGGDQRARVVEVRRLLEDVTVYTQSRHSALAVDRMRRVACGEGPSALNEPIHSVHSGAYGRLCWDMPAPTITTRFDTPAAGRFTHPACDRTLTPREAARIQSFPDDYIFCGTRRSICRQIGNAVPPKISYFLARLIQKYCNE